MGKTKSILFIFCLTTLMNCNSVKKTTTPDSINNKISYPSVIIKKDISTTDFGAPFHIDSLGIEKNIITILVSYSGGCAQHQFSLFSNQNYMKCLPPKLILTLTHKNNNDNCRGRKIETLKYNIADLQFSGQKSISIGVNNFPDNVFYKY